ncbi:hypothetical protein [Thermococcus sp. JCM 11816]|uniref:hypothetical protein n=1 Tax=Thermococcus sp. (strain JCM 11816 / KS-1) TaxID=1295125 RepID=UPI000AE2821E
MSEEIYSPEMKAYFESLQREIDRAYEIARKARAQGKDRASTLRFHRLLIWPAC